jgi:hypothetical protein
VYEDPWVKVVVPQTIAAVAGHLQVQSKLPATTLAELSNEQMEHFFFVASYAGTAIFEYLGVQGTNMLLTENSTALCIDILARRENDGLGILWSPSQVPQNELQSSAKQIKDAYDILLWHEQQEKNALAQKVSSPAPVKSTSSSAVPKQEQTSSKPKENYLLKHLRRVP